MFHSVRVDTKLSNISIDVVTGWQKPYFFKETKRLPNSVFLRFDLRRGGIVF